MQIKFWPRSVHRIVLYIVHNVFLLILEKTENSIIYKIEKIVFRQNEKKKKRFSGHTTYDMQRHGNTNPKLCKNFFSFCLLDIFLMKMSKQNKIALGKIFYFTRKTKIY